MIRAKRRPVMLAQLVMPTSTADLHFNLGVALYNQGRIDEAIAAYSRAIQAEPTFDKAYNNRGYVQFVRKNYSEALADLDEAVRLNPKNDLALSNRGAVLASLERLDEALADLTRAIAINAGNAQVFSDRAGIYMDCGRVEDAKKDLERALALDANCATAHYHRGALYATAGELAAAYPCFARAARLGFTVARDAAEDVLERMYVQATDAGLMRHAIEAFVDAESEDDLRALCEKHPYVLLPDFYGVFLGEKYENLPQLRERASILQEFAREYGLR
jgi:tetratricopeptide (TPR) repeat protein